MFKRFAVPLLLVMAFAIPSLTQESAPPRQALAAEHPLAATHPPVKVVLVKSFVYLPLTGWHQLKTEWPTFGNIPIIIDDTTLINTDFDYDDLVDSGADVLVLSDPAGGAQVYSPEEIAAVARYAFEGHTILGTFAVFQFENVDDRGLAPIFGIRRDIDFAADQISNTFRKDAGHPCLLTGIPGRTWQSNGFPNSQVPADTFNWNADDLKGSVLADSDRHTGIITTYDAGTYTAIYISNYPEFYGGLLDKQLLYNAVTCFPRK